MTPSSDFKSLKDYGITVGLTQARNALITSRLCIIGGDWKQRHHVLGVF
jgi:hypothetical protein